jgi:hypothetical protein
VHHRGIRIVKGPHQTFRFFRSDGIELVAAPKPARPSGSIPIVGASGRPITPDTSIPHSYNNRPDYAEAIAGLCWLEENAHKPEVVNA